MRTFKFLRRGSPFAIALALMITVLLSPKSFAATDWTEIRTAFGDVGSNGFEMPGNVLRFELVRQDLTITVNGVILPPSAVPEYANGYIGFKQVDDSLFFADGALPAQETELTALQDALRKDKHIHITAITNHIVLESPKLIWVHFEATENGPDLAKSLAAALTTIHSPQLKVGVIPGTNTVFNPSQLLPPKFLKLFDEGFVEQLDLIFAFYLPRPHEQRLYVGPVNVETGLGIGQSFYIQIPIEGGSNNATLNIDFALRADEIQPVSDLLRAGGFTISTQHSQFVNDSPHLYFVHASASGDGFSLGNTLYDVIQIIQQKSAQDRDHDWDYD
jgi:hypothetical protein